jgi:pyruvate dehydrogenase E1 component
MYLLRSTEAAVSKNKQSPRVQLMGSGAILREVEAAAALLADDWNVSADIWSVTSFNELRRDGIDAERWNLLHPTEKARIPFVAQSLGGHVGPVIASTDYIRTFADHIRPYIPATSSGQARRYVTLGTDGFGRSDYRAKLRSFFEVDRHYVALSALKALADDGEVPVSLVTAAIAKYNIDPNKPNPVTV